MRKVICFLTWHCPLRRDLIIMGEKNRPTWRCHYDNKETAVHILYKCEAYLAYRFEYLDQHLLKPWELHDILVHCLLNFASGTGLFQIQVCGQYHRPLVTELNHPISIHSFKGVGLYMKVQFLQKTYIRNNHRMRTFYTQKQHIK